MKHVHIYGTFGPKCRDAETLKQMFSEGMDGMRLNLSHGTLTDASDLLTAFREAAAACEITPELLIDLNGPELRIGTLPAPMTLSDGDVLEPCALPLPDAVQNALKQLSSPAPGVARRLRAQPFGWELKLLNELKKLDEESDAKK